MNGSSFYQQNGYTILPDFISTKDCDSLMQRAHELVAGFQPEDDMTIFSAAENSHATDRYFLDSGDKVRFFFEKGAFDSKGDMQYQKARSINKIAHALHQCDPLFSAFSHSDKIIKQAQALNISDPVILQSMYIFKQPFIGDEIICHQDNTYLYVKDHPVTGFWFALEDATIENGCMWVMPGGHRSPLKSRMVRHGDVISFETYDHSPWAMDALVPLEVPRGTMIVLHGLLPHMSRANTSPKSRHAYTIHMMSAEHDYASDNWLRR